MTVPSSLYRIALALLLICGVVGCGDKAKEETKDTTTTTSENTPPAGGTTSDNSSPSESAGVCKLLSAQEASEILGFKVAEGKEESTSCTYDLVPPSMSGLVVGQLQGQVGYDAAGTKSMEPVSGIGDKAAWAEGGLVFMKGEKVISITIINPKQGMSTKEPLTKIAEKIASRL